MDTDSKILERYFNNKYSRRDYARIKSLFKKEKDSNFLREEMKKQWDNYSSDDKVLNDFSNVLNRIHAKAGIKKDDKKSIQFWNFFQKTAAILIIPLVLSLFAVIYYYQNINGIDQPEMITTYAEINCPDGARTEFWLPDGSTGFLNSGSKLKYAVGFSNGRSVNLRGEAYFNIVADKEKPFVVHTPNLNINVLGTEFNVIAYPDEDNEQVILNRGLVEVELLDRESFKILKPDQKLVFDTKNKTFNTDRVTAYQYMGWTDGKLIFRDENMKRVVERLNRWYNVNINIQDNELLKYTFHATFIDEQIEQVLKYMALTTPLKYKELKREKDENGIYPKRAFIVKLDNERVHAFY